MKPDDWKVATGLYAQEWHTATRARHLAEIEASEIISRGGFDAAFLHGRDGGHLDHPLGEGWRRLPKALEPVQRQRMLNAERDGSGEIHRAPDGRLVAYRDVAA